MASNHERVHSISSAPRSRAEDRSERTRNYLIAMTIRTVSFVLAGVFATVVPWQPGVWICIAAAVVLPYPAVVYANRQDRRAGVVDSEPVVQRMLTAEPVGPRPTSPRQTPVVVPGGAPEDRDDEDDRERAQPRPRPAGASAPKKKWWVG